MKKKLNTELSDSELLDLLGSDTEVILDKEIKKETKLQKVLNFISKYNLKSGQNEVYTQALYQLFKLDHPEVTFRSFQSVAKKMFPYEKRRTHNVFFLEQDAILISDSVRKLLEPNKRKTIQLRNKKRHIEGFIKYFKIEPGANAIKFPILADLYDRWTFKFKYKRFSNPSFSALLGLYIPNEKIGDIKYFKVSNEIFKVMSKRQLENISKETTSSAVKKEA